MFRALNTAARATSLRSSRLIHVEARLKELGVELPCEGVKTVGGNFLPIQQTGNLVYLSGQIPFTAPGVCRQGRVGADVTTEEAYECAKVCTIRHLAVLKNYLGDLDKVVKIVKLTGYVNAVETFGEHPKVLNGSSDFLVEVFGEKGRHSRAAVGMGGLPRQVPVEVEMIAEVANE